MTSAAENTPDLEGYLDSRAVCIDNEAGEQLQLGADPISGCMIGTFPQVFVRAASIGCHRPQGSARQVIVLKFSGVIS